MDHAVDLRSRKGGVERGHVGEVELVEGEAIATRFDQRRHPVALQADRVIGIEVVDPHHHVAARQQGAGQGVTNEAGGAGNQNAHGASPNRRALFHG